jgi:nitrite transporter NirC
MNKLLLSSILGGIFLSIATLTFLQTDLIIGSFLFCFGLLSICHFKFDLFTGKISYINFTINDFKQMGIIILGNILGALILFIFPTPEAILVVMNKISAPFFIVFVKAILCNILIYTAVESYKNNNLLLFVLSIMSFIISGFEHSIANICFLIAARMFSIKILFYWVRKPL